MKRKITLVLLAVGLMFCLATEKSVRAEQPPFKVATISIQKIITESKAGQDAQKKLEAKVAELQGKLQKDQDALEAMQKEVETKSSVWSAEVRAEKERDYQKKMRDFQSKSEDAQFELKQQENKFMGPILQSLHDVITEYGKKNGYTLIMENTKKGMNSRVGLMYADDSLDISDAILKELNTKLAAAAK